MNLSMVVASVFKRPRLEQGSYGGELLAVSEDTGGGVAALDAADLLAKWFLMMSTMKREKARGRGRGRDRERERESRLCAFLSLLVVGLSYSKWA